MTEEKQRGMEVHQFEHFHRQIVAGAYVHYVNMRHSGDKEDAEKFKESILHEQTMKFHEAMYVHAGAFPVVALPVVVCVHVARSLICRF